jgi:hypothetical protein
LGSKLPAARTNSTIAQQSLKPAPILGRDAHRRAQGKPAAVVSLFHLLAVVFVQKPAPYEGAQNAAAFQIPYRLGMDSCRYIRSRHLCVVIHRSALFGRAENLKQGLTPNRLTQSPLRAGMASGVTPYLDEA